MILELLLGFQKHVEEAVPILCGLPAGGHQRVLHEEPSVSNEIESFPSF